VISAIVLLLQLVKFVQEFAKLSQRGGTQIDLQKGLPKLTLSGGEQIGSLIPHDEAGLEMSY
jgi:hypothetical protein